MGKNYGRFKSRKDRVHKALQMYHGIGTDEHSVEEIADYLNVKTGTVEEYLYESPQSEEIQKALDDLAVETRKQVVMDLRQRLRDLNELEEELKEAVEIVVTDFRFEDVELEVTGSPGRGVTVSEESNSKYDDQVPVPNRVKEVPQFDRLREVWEEKSETQEQLAELLGMNEPDQVEHSGKVDITEQKVYALDAEESEYPEQEVEDVEDADSL